MASPLSEFKEFPTPDGERLRAFLASCPAFTDVEADKLATLASELKLLRYDDGTRFFSDVAPNHESPLRFVVQGRASWDSDRGLEQKSAWMMTPGSVFGLEGLNDWARRSKIEGAWDRGESPRICCQALGPIWVLELPADRFESALMTESGKLALDRLLEHVPTCVYSPDIVATMRANSQFVRAAAQHLYKLLEWAPTRTFEPVPDDGGEAADHLDVQAAGSAIYYVIEGSLRLRVDSDVRTIGPGELDGNDLFRSPLDSLFEPQAIGKTVAVMLTKDMLQAYIRLKPGFARSLGPHSEQGEP